MTLPFLWSKWCSEQRRKQNCVDAKDWCFEVFFELCQGELQHTAKGSNRFTYILSLSLFDDECPFNIILYTAYFFCKHIPQVKSHYDFFGTLFFSSPVFMNIKENLNIFVKKYWHISCIFNMYLNCSTYSRFVLFFFDGMRGKSCEKGLEAQFHPIVWLFGAPFFLFVNSK